jgi:hypothetical protein
MREKGGKAWLARHNVNDRELQSSKLAGNMWLACKITYIIQIHIITVFVLKKSNARAQSSDIQRIDLAPHIDHAMTKTDNNDGDINQKQIAEQHQQCTCTASRRNGLRFLSIRSTVDFSTK